MVEDPILNEWLYLLCGPSADRRYAVKEVMVGPTPKDNRLNQNLGAVLVWEAPSWVPVHGSRLFRRKEEAELAAAARSLAA